MAGLPLGQGSKMPDLASALAQSSPAVNPKTPNTRVEPKDKYLERLRAIRALIKSITDDQLTDDDVAMHILESFNSGIRNLLLGLPGAQAMQVLQQTMNPTGPGQGFASLGAGAMPSPPVQPGAMPPQAPPSQAMPGGPPGGMPGA